MREIMISLIPYSILCQYELRLYDCVGFMNAIEHTILILVVQFYRLFFYIYLI